MSLGKIAMNGQALEVAITLVLARTLRVVPTVAAQISGRLGVGQTLDLIADLTTDDAVGKWVSTARSAVAARNEAIHTAWWQDPDTAEVGRWHRRTLSELPVVSEAELEATASKIAHAIEAFKDMAGPPP
jgi:hypothetical protein